MSVTYLHICRRDAPPSPPSSRGTHTTAGSSTAGELRGARKGASIYINRKHLSEGGSCWYPPSPTVGRDIPTTGDRQQWPPDWQRRWGDSVTTGTVTALCFRQGHSLRRKGSYNQAAKAQNQSCSSEVPLRPRALWEGHLSPSGTAVCHLLGSGEPAGWAQEVYLSEKIRHFSELFILLKQRHKHLSSGGRLQQPCKKEVWEREETDHYPDLYETGRLNS